MNPITNNSSLNPNTQVRKLKEGGKNKKKTINNKFLIKCLIEHETEIKDAMKELYVSFAFAPVQHDLLMYIDDDGGVSLKVTHGLLISLISSKKNCLIYSCGGMNMSIWDELPSLNTLLGEDYDHYIDRVAQKISKERNNVTIMDMHKYIEEAHPQWIQTWLDEYFSDPNGYIENFIDEAFDNLLFDLEEYDE